MLRLEGLDKLEAKGQAENTKRATSWGIKKFEKWCDKRKLKVDFNCVTPVELNELLRKFYAEVKSEKGQPLTPSTLTGIRAAIHRQLTSAPTSRSMNNKSLSFVDASEPSHTLISADASIAPISHLCCLATRRENLVATE